jgi:hypothetical protein
LDDNVGAHLAGTGKTHGDGSMDRLIGSQFSRKADLCNSNHQVLPTDFQKTDHDLPSRPSDPSLLSRPLPGRLYHLSGSSILLNEANNVLL